MTENEIQRNVFKHFRQRAAPGVFALHPKNGGIHQRGRRAGINTGLGVIPGVPDIIAFKPLFDDGATCCAAYALELKTETGKVGPAQEDILQRLKIAGVTVGVARGLDEALRWLEQHELLRGTAA